MKTNSLAQYKWFSSKLVIPIILIVPNILIWAGILAVDGIIIQRDFNFPIFNENFEESYFPLWNDSTSQTNIERFPRLIMMSPFLALSLLGLEVSLISKIMIVSTFTFITFSSYLLIKSVSTYIVASYHKKYARNISLLGAFIFAYNPVNLQFIGGISLLASVGMLPLLLYIVFKAGTKKYFPLLIAPPLIFSLGHPFVFVMNVILTALFFIIVYHKMLRLKYILSKLVISLALVTLLLAWLIVPYLGIQTSSIELGRELNLERDTFELVSDNNFFSILLLERDKFIYTVTEPSDTVGNMFHYLSLALVVVIAFVSFLLSINNNLIQKRIIIFLAGGFVASTFLALGAASIFDQPYWFFISESGIGWIFRSPLKFQLYQGLFVSVLLVMSLAIIRNRIVSERNAQIKAIISPSLLVLLLIGNSAYGIYNANVFSFNPIQLPKEYFEINDILETKSDESKVIYYPRYNEIATPWSQGHLIGPYDARSSKVPTYDLSTSYSYVKQMLFDYPYTNGLLNSPHFLELLSSVGIKYIVFHNDRGYPLDQKNLEYLLDSNNLSILYNNNDWYLFEIKGEPLRQIRAVHNIAETDKISTVAETGSRSLAVIDTSISGSSSYPPNNDLIKLRIFENNLDIRLKNEVENPSFLSWHNDGSLESWQLLNQAFSTVGVLDQTTNEHVIELSTDRSGNNIWSHLISNEILVESGRKYLFALEAKTENAYGTHVKIQGYHASQNAWIDLVFITTDPQGLSPSMLSIRPNSDWTEYSKILSITNDDIAKIRYVINAGSVADKSLGKGLTLIKYAGVYDLNNISSSNQSTTVNFVKINPTKYMVNIINQDGPFVLSFSEPYEKGWVASLENQEIQSIPLYGMINGFYVDKTGMFSIDINYKPQEFFWIGAGISILTVVGIIAYLSVLYYGKIKKYIRDPRLVLALAIPQNSFAEQISDKTVSKLLEGRKNVKETGVAFVDVDHFEKEGKKITKVGNRIERKSAHINITPDNIRTPSMKEALISMIRNNPYSIIVILAICLTVCIPFLAILEEDLANIAASYSLGFLLIGIIAKFVLPQKKQK